MSKQANKTLRRKARQAAAFAKFLASDGKIRRTLPGGRQVEVVMSFDQMPQRGKQLIVEKFGK